jgi:hypothetical protein
LTPGILVLRCTYARYIKLSGDNYQSSQPTMKAQVKGAFKLSLAGPYHAKRMAHHCIERRCGPWQGHIEVIVARSL